jgi:MraZ protein
VPVFLGTHTPRLDDKGRLALPARFRAEFEGGLVICKGQDRCLNVYPSTEFVRVTEALRSASMTNAAVRAYSRNLFSGASNEVPDGQGRITIPPLLRQYAGLTKECVVSGANTHVEVWEAQTWQDYLAATEPDYAGLDQEVMPGLL